jgi:hypothetical protein
VHRDVRHALGAGGAGRLERAAMLSDAERRVLTVHCVDHFVATCEDCRRDYQFTALGFAVLGKRYYSCPSCRVDLVDELRLHILHCRGIEAVLKERVHQSRQLIKQNSRLRVVSTILAAESHAVGERLLEIRKNFS